MTDDQQPCPGQCNHTWRKLERSTARRRERALAQPTPPPADQLPTNPERPHLAECGVWCASCAGQILAAVQAVDGLCTALLRLPLGKLHAVPTERVGKTPKMVAPASPSPALDLADELSSWLGVASDLVRDQLPVPVPGSGPTFLVQWRLALFSQPLQGTVQQLLRLVPHALAAAGLDDVVHRLPAPCPTCDRKGLARKDGAKLVVCGVCGSSWDEDHNRRLAFRLAAQLPPPKPARRRSARLVAAQYAGPSNTAGRDAGHPNGLPLPVGTPKAPLRATGGPS